MPSNLSNIKSKISDILKSIENIGNVYYGIQYATEESELLNLYQYKDELRGIWFRAKQRKVDIADEDDEIIRTWEFEYLYQYSKDSENRLDELIENICETFENNYTLQGSVREHTGMQMTDKTESEIGGILCFIVNLELTTYESI